MSRRAAGLSPELQLLLTLLRAGMGTSPPPFPRSDAVDWNRFLRLVERHRVAPRLHRNRESLLAALVPPAVTRNIGQSAAATLQKALRQASVQFDLTRRLETAGIEVLTVKGLVLAQQLHGGPGGRHVGDIDLVVRPGDVVRADAILQDAGFRRTRPEGPLTPRQTSEYRRLKPEYEYVLAASKIRLELLWRLEGLPELDALWPRATTCDIGGRIVRTVSADDNALYLFQHGARHGWFRLFWLVDIALLLRSTSFDWSALADRARRDGGLRALWQGAALAKNLLGIPVPPALAPRPGRERRAVRALALEAQRQLVRPVSAKDTTAEWFRQAAYRVRVQDTSRHRLAMLAPHLSSPLNWQTLPLPDRWFFLYPLLSPLLWLWRAARRGGWSR